MSNYGDLDPLNACIIDHIFGLNACINITPNLEPCNIIQALEILGFEDYIFSRKGNAMKLSPEESIELIRKQAGPVKDYPDLFPPGSCMRLRDDPQVHVLVAGYAEKKDLTPCILVVEGADSANPGLKVIDEGPDREGWVDCNCGKWGKATPEQEEQTIQSMNMLHNDDSDLPESC